MVFFSNAMKDIESCPMNWNMCPVATIYWFLLRKECEEGDVVKMLEQCFSPNKVAKINNVSCERSCQMTVLKEKINADMTLVIQNFKQFDMTKGFSKKERVSKVQQLADNRINFWEATRRSSRI